MRTKALKLIITVFVCLPAGRSAAIDRAQADAFAGRDVHIRADKVSTFRSDAPDSISVLLAEKNLEIAAGADLFKADKALVWFKQSAKLATAKPGEAGHEPKSVSVWCCLSGKIAASKGKGVRLPGLNWQTLDTGLMLIWFDTAGEVFVTSQSPSELPRQSLAGEFYQKAFSALSSADPDFARNCQSVAPAKIESSAKSLPLPPAPRIEKPQAGTKTENQRPGARQRFAESAFGFIENIFGSPKKQSAAPGVERPSKIRYPVNIAPAGAAEPNIETGLADGREIATVIGRFYLWQKQDDPGNLLEMQADAAVIFYSTQKSSSADETGVAGLAAKDAILAVYLRGDVVFTEGLRTLRADEMYYNFESKIGLALNAALRIFDVARGIPVYVRAAQIRRLAENKFSASDVVLTTSEFAEPQVSMLISNILIADSTAFVQHPKDTSLDVQMEDVRLKTDSAAIFRWPYMRTNLQRPDVALKSVRVGSDSVFGTSVETRWFLSRLLGLREPDGTSETLDLDYFSKRGLGAGIDVDYKQENHLGKIAAYIIDDHGQDRLGRVRARRDLEPPEELRGRFSWVHREFMPYNWQLTTGINYESDEHFVESFYRREFDTGPDRETYIHLKRIEDNWGLSLLGKGRINDFADELEQYPSGEFHLTGQSLFDDKFTLYSDSQAGLFRQRIGDNHDTAINDKPFTNASHRTELDLPIWTGSAKIVPFVAGTVGYDDRSEFNRSLVNGDNAGSPNEDAVAVGEAGLRASTEFWKVYKSVNSRLWDVHGLRHIVRPEIAATLYAESDPVVDQHNVLNFNLAQVLQTKRGPMDNQKSVDWMRLNLGATFFADNEPRTADSAPYRFIWNRPLTPLRLFTMPSILNGDLPPGLKKFETFGPQRDYLSADYCWQISDTTAILGDAYYDLHEGTIEQLNLGFTRSRWPDLTYYVGSRYLRNVQILDQHGSNAFVFAASYNIDERYTVIFSQQYDFDYGANVTSDITIIRRYHRVFWSISVGADESLDNKSIAFSIWPQGVPELALGSRRYTGLASPSGY